MVRVSWLCSGLAETFRVFAVWGVKGFALIRVTRVFAA
jgi:hypothetical protein